MACIRVSTQSDAPRDQLLRYDGVAFPCACSTTSVSRSSSAITSSPNRVARSGRRTARARARVVRIISPCAFREIVHMHTSCKTCCIGVAAVWQRLWRWILSTSTSEADQPCASGLDLLLDVRKRWIVVLYPDHCCPSHTRPPERHVCVQPRSEE
jgi:hypothetical protein